MTLSVLSRCLVPLLTPGGLLVSPPVWSKALGMPTEQTQKESILWFR
ncbi:MAG: hypothetical protein U1D30_16525 [Planctomycetota bacterium]